MNYLKTYCSLIRKAENRTPPEGYTERHHIFPKSIFGNNNRVVALTAREHYIAHALLEKVYMNRYGVDDNRTKKMTYAFWGMCMRHKEEKKINSYLFELLRIRRIDTLKSIRGENHPNYGKKRSPEMIEKMRKASMGRKLSQETKKKLSEMRRGKCHPFYGKNHTEDAKKNISKNRKGKGLHSDEWRMWMSEKMKNNNPFKGKFHTEETKEKMRGKKVDEKVKQKLSELNCKLECKLINPEGEIFFIKNLPQFCKKTNLSYCSMHRVVSGKRKTHKGWTGFLINKKNDNQ